MSLSIKKQKKINRMYFYEQVNNLRRASNKWQCNDIMLKMVMCQMTNNLNVFGASMKDQSVGNLMEIVLSQYIEIGS